MDYTLKVQETKTAEKEFLFEEAKVQSIDNGEGTLPLLIRGPVREGFKNQILILVSAPLLRKPRGSNIKNASVKSIRTDIPPLVVWDEILSVAEALRKIQPPTQFELKLVIANANEFREELFLSERPLIMHFIGHGMNNPGFRGLIIEDDIGTAKELNEDGLKKILSPFGNPPCYLAVLNACHSEILSETLINSGVQFVISVNTDDEILDTAARTFTKYFYPALLKEYLSVRQAFEIARDSVSDNYWVEGLLDHKTYRPAKETEPVKYNLMSRFDQDKILSYEVNVGTVVFPTWDDRTNLTIRSENVFLGRHSDMYKINIEILRNKESFANTCLVINGLPGMGKTELAKAVGRWQHERRRWIDGVWYVDLRNVINASLARDLIQNSIPDLPNFGTAGNDTLKTWPVFYQTLIILDDLDQLLNNDPLGCYDLINSLLVYPGVQLLITSREYIPLSYVQNFSYPLKRLDDSATIKIFKEYSHLFDPQESLTDLIDFLQGYPFPTKLAAAYMKARGLSIHELYERVQECSENVMRDPRAKPSRDTVLSIALDLSYQVLPKNVKDSLHLLAIFPSGMIKRMVKHLRGQSGVDALEDLLGYSMVEVMNKDPVRFALPEPARQYVLSKLGKKTGNLINRYGRRTLEYFENYLIDLLGVYNLVEPEDISLMGDVGSMKGDSDSGKLLDEANNLREFLNWGYKKEKSDQSVCYSARVTALLAVNYAQLPESEREILLDRIDKASMAAERLGDTFALARIFQGKGEIYLKTENLNGALDSLLSAKKYYEPSGEDQNLGAIYYKIGNVYQRTDQPDPAIKSYQESAEIFRKFNSLTDAARAYRNIGHTKLKVADFKGALKAYMEAIQLFLEKSDYNHAAYIYQRIGDIQREQGNTHTAIVSYKQAANYYRDGRDMKMEGVVHELIGDISHEDGLYNQAEMAYQEAIQLYKIVNESRVTLVEEKLKKLKGLE